MLAAVTGKHEYHYDLHDGFITERGQTHLTYTGHVAEYSYTNFLHIMTFTADSIVHICVLNKVTIVASYQNIDTNAI